MSEQNDFIDSVMNEATEVDVQETDNSIKENVEENEAEDVIDQNEEDSEEDDSDDVDSALEKLKKSNKKKLNYIRNLREREKNLLSEIEKLKTQEFSPKQLNAEEFDGPYGEFIKQQALEEMRAELGQTQQKQQLDQLSLQQQQLMAEQNQMIAQEAAQYAKQSEDFANVVPANADRFNNLSDEVQSMFFDLENPTLAAYALAKEGKIEQLAFMSPYMAAVEIRNAEARGLQYLQSGSKKQVSNAPLPVNAVKGTSKVGNSRLAEKNPDELYKWITS